MPLSVCRLNTNKVEPIRYHVTLKNGKRFSIGKYDPAAADEIKKAASHETCIEERCYICFAHGLALMPMVPLGETLIFSSGDYDRYGLNAVVVVTKEFDPYDEAISTVEDIVSKGYGKQVYFTEIWEE